MRRAMTPCVHTTTKTASVRHDHSICRLCGLYPRNQVSRLAVLPQTPVKTHNQLSCRWKRRATGRHRIAQMVLAPYCGAFMNSFQHGMQ